jgi:hypothetical protein
MPRIRTGLLVTILCLIISAPASAQIGSLWNNNNNGGLLVVADFSSDPGLEAITTLSTSEVVMISLNSGAQLREFPSPFNSHLTTTYRARDFNGDGLAEILCVQPINGPSSQTRVGLLELDSRDEFQRVWPDVLVGIGADYSSDISLSAAEPNTMVFSSRDLVLFSPESGTVIYDSSDDPGIGAEFRLESFIIDDFNEDGNEEILCSFATFGGPPYLTTLIGDTGVSSVQDFESTFGIMMSAGWPNPTSGLNHIAYELPKGSHVSLKVYDVAGRHVRTVIDAQRAAGKHQAFWDGRDSVQSATAGSSAAPHAPMPPVTLRSPV